MATARPAAGLLLVAALAAACGGGGPEPVVPDPCALATPGADWLTFASSGRGNYDLFLVRADGTCLTPLTSDTGTDLLPTWTPGGNVGFQSSRAPIGMGIFVHDLATGVESQVPVDGLLAASPTWSRDGRFIAFEGTVPGLLGTNLYTVAAAGGAAVALTTGSVKNAGPIWSPDGATLYFVSNRTGPYLVYSMTAAGADQVALAGTSGVIGRPALSPDGKLLAFTRQGAGGVYQVAVITLATGAMQVVSSQGDSSPAFDATGARMAVSSTRSGRSAIWVIDAADGTHPVQVSFPTVVDAQPAFRPR